MIKKLENRIYANPEKGDFLNILNCRKKELKKY